MINGHYEDCMSQSPDGGPCTCSTRLLVARANELRDKTIANIRTNRAYYKRQSELYESWKAAKAVAISMRDTPGEVDAFRAWLEVDNAMNVERAKDRGDEDEKWSDAVRKAQKALAADAGLHLTIPEDA